MTSQTLKENEQGAVKDPQFPSEMLKATYTRVTTRMAQDAEQYFGESVPPVFSIVRIFHRPFSDIIQALVHLKNRHFGIYIKFSRANLEVEGEYERILKNTKREVEVTRKFSDFFSNEQGISVPDVIAFFPDEMAIVTKEKEGLQLMSLIVQSGKGKPGTEKLDLLRNTCFLVGNALNIFQKMPLINTGKDELPSNLISYVEVRLKLLSESGFIKMQEYRSVVTYLEKQLLEVDEQTLKLCGIHGDLSFGNFLVSSDQVVFLDLGMYRQGPPSFDPSYVCQHLDAFLTNPVFFISTMVSLQDAFLEGYQPGFSRKDPLFCAYYVLNMANHLLALSRTRHLPLLKKIYQKRQYRQYLFRLKKVIQEA